MKTEICIIGAGPAGLTAAIFAGRCGAKTILLEANASAGRKLLCTGAGRCNLTHNTDLNDFIRSYGPHSRFLRYAVHNFSPALTRTFFAELGLLTKAEPDGCVFPATYRAVDVKKALITKAKKIGVNFLYSSPAVDIQKAAQNFLVHTGKQQIHTEKVIVATGGLSWPDTGSRGDGYRFAQKLGHKINQPKPVLVPLVTNQTWPGDLAGTSLQNVTISAKINNKGICLSGPMVFTHNGIGGPVVLDFSRFITDLLPSPQSPVKVSIDLLPGIDPPAVDKMMLEQFEKHPRKSLVAIIAMFVPRRMATVLCRQFDFDAAAYGRQTNKKDRMRLVGLLKNLRLDITATRPLAEAIATRGGVATEQINPKTMESKICPGLFFAGEIIDIDGPCGGYNLQICWSTGALAGQTAASK